MEFTLKKRRGKEFDAVGIPRKIEYSEMVVRLLQFGPVIKVLELKYMVGEIVRRLGMQLRLMGQGNELKRCFYDKKIF